VSAVVDRYGMTIPLEGVALDEQASVAAELAALGYTDVWSSEGMGADAFTPLAVAATAAPSLRLGSAIVPVFTRGPACLAQSAATLAATAPGRFVLGVGTSSDVIVERWNDVAFERPYERTRDMVRFLRKAFAGERVDETFDTFAVRGFRLGIVPSTPPKILVAALRSGMLRLAGAEADGAIINWLSAGDVATAASYVHAGGEGKEIVARIMVIPTTDAGAARAMGRRLIATYLNVPVYREFHRWLGREDRLGEMWTRWSAGDRKGAAAAVPDSVVDELIIHGSADACREHIARYVSNGVTTPVIALLPADGSDVRAAMRQLAPTQ
jgi:probable F420-dependent oxidoreductase